MIELRDYQAEAVEAMRNMKKGMRGIVNAPTGAGKTIIMAKYCQLQSDKRILVVVDAEELVNQTKDKMSNFISEEEIGLIQSDKYNQVNRRITVGMRQSLLHPKSDRITNILEHGQIDVLIIDECHIAPTSQMKLIELLNPGIVIGLSATPYSDLEEVYKDREIYSIPIMKLIKEGHLCQPRAFTAYSDVDLSNIKTVMGEFNQGELAEAINIESRNKLIVDKWKEVASDRKHTIAFCASIEHAQQLSEEFNKAGIPASNLDSTFSNQDRKEVIRKYESGEIKVVCQIGIMVKGYDFKPTDCILLCKSTSSLMYYQQSVGRGLRSIEGKEDCLVIDIVDSCRKKNMTLLNMGMVFGLKDGENIDDMEKRLEQEQEEERLKREREEQEREIRKREIERLILEEINLFNENIFNIRSNSSMDWYFNKIGSADVAILTVSKYIDFYIVSKEGTYTSYKRIKGEGYTYELEVISESNSLKELQEEIEQLAEGVENSGAYTNPKCRWKLNENITEKQRQACKGKEVKSVWDVMKYWSKRSSWFCLKDIV